MNSTKKKLSVFKKIESIMIVGRRWFDKTYGNTYHSSEIYVDNDLVHKIDFSYGYNDQYIWNSFNWLKNNGYLNGYCENKSFRSWCEENNIKLNTTVSDVKRKKDL